MEQLFLIACRCPDTQLHFRVSPVQLLHLNIQKIGTVVDRLVSTLIHALEFRIHMCTSLPQLLSFLFTQLQSEYIIDPFGSAFSHVRFLVGDRSKILRLDVNSRSR